MLFRVFIWIVSATLATLSVSCSVAPRIPDKLVVLTFDDGNMTDRTFVGPLLKEYGFGGTFFVNKSGGAFGHPERFMTWEDVKWLHDAGFEIGNHTANHRNVRKQTREEFGGELEAIEKGCVKHGIPRPISFCYCGYQVSKEGVEVLEERGYLLARRGVDPEFDKSDNGDRGPTYEPNWDHPLLIPTTGASGPNWKTFDDFVSVVDEARDGKIVVLTFHGIPTDLHPWVHTDPETFRRYLDYLRDHDFKVVALRDVLQFIDRGQVAGNPFEPIDRRLRITPVDLTGVAEGAARPSFSWICKSSHEQKPSAYQILVASSQEKLAANDGDLWDSGKVASTNSESIPYGGRLEEGTTSYWWKVRVWNQPSGALLDRLKGLDAPIADQMTKEKPGSYSEPSVWIP